MWCLTKKGLAAQIQQAPFSSWKLNRWCSQVQSASSYFLPRVPLRQIPCSLFEFVLAGLSHCKQRSVTAHTIACVGWGLWGTAVGRWAINTYSPGAQSLLYSSVKIQLSWFSETQSCLFLFRNGLCLCDKAYITTTEYSPTAAYRFHTVLYGSVNKTRGSSSSVCSLMVRLYSSDTVGKGAMRIIGNVFAIHSIQRVFMGQIDRNGVS